MDPRETVSLKGEKGVHFRNEGAAKNISSSSLNIPHKVFFFFSEI
jgi:hypothetical protein